MSPHNRRQRCPGNRAPTGLEDEIINYTSGISLEGQSIDPSSCYQTNAPGLESRDNPRPLTDHWQVSCEPRLQYPDEVEMASGV